MASLTNAVRRTASRVQARSFSAVTVDWSSVRAKMMTEETRAEADRAKDAFLKRLSAAEGVGEPQEIDWAAYKAKLPELDVDAIKASFEKQAKETKPVTYDESADAAAHAAKEAAFTGFSAYCAARVKDLVALAEEQSKNKLHRWYRRRQLYSRFPGLYESLHNKVRGTWDVALWGQYIAYKAKASPLPWEPTTGDVDDAKTREIMLSISSKAGTTPEALGFTLPKETAAAPAKAAH